MHWVQIIELQAHRLGHLRLYGLGWGCALNESSTGLALVGGRVLHQSNLRGVLFGNSPCVEIWASTSQGTIGAPSRHDRDRIPGLTWAFLAGGASGVVDLTWPVHDLVKALVCEQFGIHNIHGPVHGGNNLIAAVSRVAEMLSIWRPMALKTGSVSEALSLLDGIRQKEAYPVH